MDKTTLLRYERGKFFGTCAGTCDKTKEKRLFKNRKTGQYRCLSCRRNDPSTWEECSGCHNDRSVAHRLPSSDPLCEHCAKRDIRLWRMCAICDTLKYIVTHTRDGRDVCRYCRSQDTSKYQRCVGCPRKNSRKKPVAINLGDGFYMCHTCYKQGKHKIYFATHEPTPSQYSQGRVYWQ